MLKSTRKLAVLQKRKSGLNQSNSFVFSGLRRLYTELHTDYGIVRISVWNMFPLPSLLIPEPAIAISEIIFYQAIYLLNYHMNRVCSRKSNVEKVFIN